MTSNPNPCQPIERCRICNSTELDEVISLGDQYISSLFPIGPVPDEIDKPFPLEVVRCSGAEGCGLVQLRHTVAPGILYDYYGYRSATNEMMRSNLLEITRQIEEMVGLGEGELVIDVGCNDGTLLESYETTGILRLGVDPSDAVKAIDRSDISVINDFFGYEAVAATFPGKKARAITSIAMFYDLDDPAIFVGDIARLLAHDGVWVIELSYLASMLRMKAFDTICHEHLEYYSLRTIERLLESEQLRVHRAEINDVNGGSIRLFIRHSSYGDVSPEAESALQAIRDDEEMLGLRTDRPYESFKRECIEIRDRLTGLLRELKANDKIVYIYGASTKGNTLLQFCGIDNSLIDKAADRNPDKWGTKTIGTGIPIVSEAEARADQPNYFLALPWHFFDSFVKREREFLESGGSFILPLPEVRVLTRDHL